MIGLVSEILPVAFVLKWTGYVLEQLEAKEVCILIQSGFICMHSSVD